VLQASDLNSRDLPEPHHWGSGILFYINKKAAGRQASSRERYEWCLAQMAGVSTGFQPTPSSPSI
jgi:hypothetical protein